MSEPIVVDFLSALEKLIRSQMKKLYVDDDDCYSLFSDIHLCGLEGDEFVTWKKEYVAEVSSYFKIKTFEIVVSDIETRLNVDTDGDCVATLIFRLDVASLFDDYDPDLAFPFYTMLFVKMEWNNWSDFNTTQDNPPVQYVQLKAESDKRLLQKASEQLVIGATQRMKLEHLTILMSAV